MPVRSGGFAAAPFLKRALLLLGKFGRNERA